MVRNINKKLTGFASLIQVQLSHEAGYIVEIRPKTCEAGDSCQRKLFFRLNIEGIRHKTSQNFLSLNFDWRDYLLLKTLLK